MLGLELLYTSPYPCSDCGRYLGFLELSLFLQSGFMDKMNRFCILGIGIKMSSLNLVRSFGSKIITISLISSLNFGVKGFSSVVTSVMRILRDSSIFSISLLLSFRYYIVLALSAISKNKGLREDSEVVPW